MSMHYTVVQVFCDTWIIECNGETICHCFSQKTADWLCCVLNNHCC